MASSENLASIEPWNFRPFGDSWFADACARDAETLTRALQKSLSGGNNTDPAFVSDTMSPFFNLMKGETVTPTVSGLSNGSDHEAAPKRQRTAVPGPGGKASKRKSRASKRSQTTFITADPANFRQMVQQVTGVRFGNSQMPAVPILKPEPQRPGGNRLQGIGCLPTLDTSAYLLDHHQQQLLGPTSAGGSGTGVSGPDHLSYGPSISVGVGGGAGGLDFDTSFYPTLESWATLEKSPSQVM